MRGFKFFRKSLGSDRLSWTLISYHSPHSLVWSWYIGFTILREGEHRSWQIYWTQKAENGNKTMVIRRCFRIPFIGIFRYARQEPMWYRDLYNQLKNHPPIVRISGQPGEKVRPIIYDSAKVIPLNADRGGIIPPYES